MVSGTYDLEANALYFKLGDQRIAKTIPMGEGKYVDVAENGVAVGVEIIFPSPEEEVINALISQKEQITLLQ